MVNKQSIEHKNKIAQRKEKNLKQDELRSIEERRFETLNIIYQLKQNNITSEFPAVRELLKQLNEYVVKGETMQIHIPFPEKNKIIKGTLPAYKSEKPMVMLKHIE